LEFQITIPVNKMDGKKAATHRNLGSSKESGKKMSTKSPYNWLIMNAKIELTMAIEELTVIAEKSLKNIHVMIGDHAESKIQELDSAVRTAKILVKSLRDIFGEPVIMDIDVTAETGNLGDNDKNQEVKIGDGDIEEDLKDEIHEDKHNDVKQRNYDQKKTQGQNTFICEQCPRTFKTLRFLKIHKHTHNKNQQYSCDKCPEIFSSKYILKQHHLIHTRDEEFSVFLTKSMLKQHHRIHTRDEVIPVIKEELNPEIKREPLPEIKVEPKQIKEEPMDSVEEMDELGENKTAIQFVSTTKVKEEQEMHNFEGLKSNMTCFPVPGGILMSIPPGTKISSPNVNRTTTSEVLVKFGYKIPAGVYKFSSDTDQSQAIYIIKDDGGERKQEKPSNLVISVMKGKRDEAYLAWKNSLPGKTVSSNASATNLLYEQNSLIKPTKRTQTFQCDMCPMRFPYYSSRSAHRLTHDNI